MTNGSKVLNEAKLNLEKRKNILTKELLVVKEVKSDLHQRW